MVGRGRHQHNEINAVLAALRKVNRAWTVVQDHNGHRWGWILCSCGEDKFVINCTPRNPGVHAKQIQRWTVKHDQCGAEEQEEDS